MFCCGSIKHVTVLQVPGVTETVVQDNGIRPTPMEKMSKLKPASIKPRGCMTAANASFLVSLLICQAFLASLKNL